MHPNIEASPAVRALEAHVDLIRRDVERWLDLFADDAVVEFPYAVSLGAPPRLVGRAAIEGYFRGALAIFTGLAFSNVRVYPTTDPNVALAEAHGSATIATTGKRYEQDYVVLVRTRGEQILLYREYWNPVPGIEALGRGELRLREVGA